MVRDPLDSFSRGSQLGPVHYLNKKSFTLGVVLGAFLKFVFLFTFATFLAQGFFNDTLLPKVIGMMSWPQFATALLGGIFAFIVLKFVKKEISL